MKENRNNLPESRPECWLSMATSSDIWLMRSLACSVWVLLSGGLCTCVNGEICKRHCFENITLLCFFFFFWKQSLWWFSNGGRTKRMAGRWEGFLTGGGAWDCGVWPLRTARRSCICPREGTGWLGALSAARRDSISLSEGIDSKYK